MASCAATFFFAVFAALAAFHYSTSSQAVSLTEGRQSLEYLNKWMRVVRMVQEDLDEHELAYLEHNQKPDTFMPPDVQNPLESVPPFDCVPEESEQSPAPPTSVHELRPSDIRVVAALGDSVTAGVGLGDVHAELNFLPNRGEAWSIGGDYSYGRNVVTIPNILRKFGSDVQGYGSCLSQENSRHSWFNLAKVDATNKEIMNQTLMLLDRLFNDSKVDPVNDWKLLTLMVGGSDLCKYCDETTRGNYTAEAYRQSIEQALDTLYERVPRMFVNIVIQFPITFFTNISNHPACDYFQIEFCPCGKNPFNRDELRETQLEYYNQLSSLVNSGKYDGREDFTVVIQPHMRDMDTPPINSTTGAVDTSYYSFDCIHFNRKGHMSLAYMLWNTMLTPVGHKPFLYNLNEQPKKLRCPTTTHKYFFTNKNSNVQWP